ncbi:MAG: AIR synthase-related protein [Paracoccus sp. (in: a-proteobacteria)]
MIACDPAALDRVLEVFRAHGFDRAGVIGQVVAADRAGVRVG